MKTKSLVVTVGFFALLALPHCGSRYSTVCDNERNCVGGNDKDVDACIEQHRAFENISSAYDCDDPWDKYATCLETVTCTNKRLTTTGCQAQASAWSSCVQAASGQKNVLSGNDSTNAETNE